MIWISTIIVVAIILAAIGAWLRADAIAKSDEPEPMEFEPHRDDRWGGDW